MAHNITLNRIVRSCAFGIVIVLALLVSHPAPAHSVPSVSPTWGNRANPFVRPAGQPGYWIFVCRSAADAGYVGDLNKAFYPRLAENDNRYPNGEHGIAIAESPDPDRFVVDTTDPALPIVRNAPGGVDLDQYFDLWDSCRNTSTNRFPAMSFGAMRRNDAAAQLLNPLRRFNWNRASETAPYEAQGNTYVGFSMGFKSGESLEIERIYVQDRLRSYRSTGYGVAEGPNHPPTWATGWGVSRATLTGERSGDQFRVCGGHGMWADGRYANTYWKNITSLGVANNGGWTDLNFSTSRFGNTSGGTNYYTENINGDIGEYFAWMTGTGPDGDPDATCQIAYDGAADNTRGEWYWSQPTQGVNMVTLFVQCSNQRPSRESCRSLDPADSWSEAPNARSNAISHGVSATAYGARFFVLDDANPTVRVTGGTLDRGGANAADGTSASETMTFSADDGAGIRRLLIRLRKPNGALVVLRDQSNFTVDGDICDYRHQIPCAGGTGHDSSRAKPAWVPAVRTNMTAPVRLNADDLPPGAYSIIVTAWDGSNRAASDTALFRVNDNLVIDCTGAEVQARSTLTNCGSSGDVCEVAATCDPATSPPIEPPTGGPYAPLPRTGRGIFSYGLAFNANANGLSPAGGGCRVIESVISGSGTGGALSARETNQIISVTLDLSGFSSLGQSLGTQDLRATFDLPARRDSRYRTALGCPG